MLPVEVSPVDGTCVIQVLCSRQSVEIDLNRMSKTLSEVWDGL